MPFIPGIHESIFQATTVAMCLRFAAHKFIDVKAPTKMKNVKMESKQQATERWHEMKAIRIGIKSENVRVDNAQCTS